MAISKDSAPQTAPMSSKSLWDEFYAGSQFFMQQGNIYETLRQLARRLEQEHLDYAIIGGMALVSHGYPPFYGRCSYIDDARGFSSISGTLAWTWVFTLVSRRTKILSGYSDGHTH